MRGTKSFDEKLFAMINTQFVSITFINVSISGSPLKIKYLGHIVVSLPAMTIIYFF